MILAIIPEISDSNLETWKYDPKPGVSLRLFGELTALGLVSKETGVHVRVEVRQGSLPPSELIREKLTPCED